MRRTIVAFFPLCLVCCTTPKPEPEKTPAIAAEPPSLNAAAVVRLGAPIEASAKPVALADVAKSPEAFAGKTFTTTGTVTAVCQHMGCWMELKDDATEAHIKMSGHAFFVPKTASGRKAKVTAKLVGGDDNAMCAGEGHGGKGCKAEAAEQMGHPVAKLELEAMGVELD